VGEGWGGGAKKTVLREWKVPLPALRADLPHKGGGAAALMVLRDQASLNLFAASSAAAIIGT